MCTSKGPVLTSAVCLCAESCGLSFEDRVVIRVAPDSGASVYFLSSLIRLASAGRSVPEAGAEEIR